MLCQKFLSDADSRDDRPKPQARAQPRALRLGRTESIGDSNKPVSKGSSVSNKVPLPDYSEMQRLMEATSSPVPLTPLLRGRIKFELLNSYGMLQNEVVASAKDPLWVASLRNGEMIKMLDVAFGSHENGASEECIIFRDTLQVIATMWSA